MTDNLFVIPGSIMDSGEWKELELKENQVGSDNLLEEIINKKVWSNAEIIWILRRLVYFYGQKDNLLKNIPPDRLLANMGDILRVLFLIFDTLDPDLDGNTKSYICAKLTDATWGVSSRTRVYLEKISGSLN